MADSAETGLRQRVSSAKGNAAWLFGGGGGGESFSGSCGRLPWHGLRCQLRGWPHTQLTNSETLFVAFPLRLFASLQYTLLSHALPSHPLCVQPPPCQGVDSCDKSLYRKHLNCISLWANLQCWAKGKANANANSVGAILKTPWLPSALAAALLSLSLPDSTLQPTTAPAFCGVAL